jgi:hypothetical protein
MAIHSVAVTNIASQMKAPDVFICGSSFESRSLTIPEVFPPDFARVVLIVRNMNLKEHVGLNAERISSRYGERARFVDTDTTDPLRTADALWQALHETTVKVPQHYLVDITTFTHECLLILLRALHDRFRERPGDSASFCYCSAENYSTRVDPGEKWLSKGVSDVRSVLGYPGEVLPSRGTHLIVLVGYEHERATRLIEDLEPSHLSLGHGTKESQTDPKHVDANNHFWQMVTDIARRLSIPQEEFMFSCSDPWEAQKVVLEAARKTPHLNIVVAPMNTKISTVGAALAAFVEPSIQICYAQARSYNYEDYSSPSDHGYIFDIPELGHDVPS